MLRMGYSMGFDTIATFLDLCERFMNVPFPLNFLPLAQDRGSNLTSGYCSPSGILKLHVHDCRALGLIILNHDTIQEICAPKDTNSL